MARCIHIPLVQRNSNRWCLCHCLSFCLPSIGANIHYGIDHPQVKQSTYVTYKSHMLDMHTVDTNLATCALFTYLYMCLMGCVLKTYVFVKLFVEMVLIMMSARIIWKKYLLLLASSYMLFERQWVQDVLSVAWIVAIFSI